MKFIEKFKSMIDCYNEFLIIIAVETNNSHFFISYY